MKKINICLIYWCEVFIIFFFILEFYLFLFVVADKHSETLELFSLTQPNRTESIELNSVRFDLIFQESSL